MNTMDSEGIRLNKYMSDCGFCSRREADRLIEDGSVTIDGTIAVLGQKVLPGQVVKCKGEVISANDRPVLIALNKPAGIECTAAADNPDNIVDFVGYPIRIYPVGRLDKQSQGLIFLTNRGELVNAILKASNYHEKEYIVSIDCPVTDDFIDKMSAGVKLDDGVVTRKCAVSRISKHSFRIILTQGLNRQIRRMCRALGCEVTSLKRVRIMNICLGDLPEGTWRNIEGSELAELERLLGL